MPNVPEIECSSIFEGLLLHSHDYRDNKKFQDLKVVVLGANASGIDVALEVAKVAKEVSLKYNYKLTTNLLKKKPK